MRIVHAGKQDVTCRKTGKCVPKNRGEYIVYIVYYRINKKLGGGVSLMGLLPPPDNGSLRSPDSAHAHACSGRSVDDTGWTVGGGWGLRPRRMAWEAGGCSRLTGRW